MADQPTGTVTLLFTDIEGSTRLLQRLGAGDYSRVLGDHHRLIRAALSACRGIEVKTEGDSFFAVFERARDAITAAVDVQRQLAGESWSTTAGASVAVRMGIHTGDVSIVENEYVGLDIHRAARIAAAAHGGQVLLSATTRELVADELPPGVSTIDLGEHKLKDLERPEHLFQLAIQGLAADFPPVRAIGARYDLLPAESTNFIGRERELAQARELLGGTRLLTLTGPGGTGKTRLSMRLAREVGDKFANGVVFIQLAAITDFELLAPTIRRALGFADEAGRSTLETLVERLRGRELLLVLDNFEQMLPAARVVATLLESTDGLKIVVTSRAVLHVTGEQEFPVPPMSLPAASDATDLAALAASESASLFIQRARTVRPDFALTEDNAGAIIAICRRLDGLPLAIELAASRIKLLSPAALLARLGRSLDVLQTTSADRTDRQTTLRGAIRWSYELLGEPERRLFRRLAIFAGGFRLEDAEVVTAAAGPVGVDVFEGVAELVDNSLVRSLGDYPDVRFGMLETILEFGREQLEASDELAVVTEALARRVALLVEAAEPHLTSGREWIDRLEANHDNVRAMLAWLANHDIQLALMTAGRLWRFWHRRGHLREGAAQLGSLLSRPEAQAPTFARAKALIGLAGLVYWQLDYAAAEQAYVEALPIAESLGDDRLRAEVLYSLVYIQALRDDLGGAQQRIDQARTIYQRLGDDLGVASSVMVDGMVAMLRSDHAHGLELMDAAMATFRRMGNFFGLQNTLGMRSRSLLELGRIDEARAVNREYLQVSFDQHEPTSLSAALLDAASLEALAGNTERAARLMGAGLRQADEAGGEAPPELVRRIELLPLLQKQLDQTSLAALVAEGRQLGAEAAVAYALGGVAGG